MSKKYVVFLDMDGVLVDFDADIKEPFNKDPSEMYVPGFFRKLKPMAGVHKAVHQILDMEHIELYVGTKATTGLLSCASEKMEWIAVHLPKLLKRVVIACDKGLLRGDILVDDNPHLWANFQGEIFHFDRKSPEVHWSLLVDKLRKLKEESDGLQKV